MSDGAGGLCTRHRVSPYALAAASLPVASAPIAGPAALTGSASAPQFMQVQVGSGG